MYNSNFLSLTYTIYIFSF